MLAALSLFALFAAPANCAEVTIGWSPNSEGDLEGYGIYFRKGSPGPPYNLAGYAKLDELADIMSPTFTVSGLDTKAEYHFAVTAYDTEGLESVFSQSICVMTDSTNSLCANNPVNNSVPPSGGGSGGGGCFIGASLKHSSSESK
jgi:hypothetical protein